MDLYDDAILGTGPTLDSAEMNSSPFSDIDNKQPNREDDIEMEDLYDDVTFPETHDVTSRRWDHESSKHHRRYSGNSSSHATTSNKSDRYYLYVGNLTWWTSESDISEAVQNIGVSDMVEVKFFENAINGQSKGFCTVTLDSEKSMRKVMDRLPDVDLHGRSPIVAYPTKNVLYQFEAKNPLRSRSKRSHR